MENISTCEFKTFLEKQDIVVIMGTIGSVLSPITVICNLITLMAIIRFHRLQTKPMLSVANISTCALLAGLAQPLLSSLMLGNFHSSKAWCPVMTAYELTEDTLLCCSFLTVCYVGFERYISIFHPFKQERFLSRGRSIAVIISIWIISIANSFLIFYWNEAEFVMSFVNLIATATGAMWISVIYFKVVLLVRSIRRRVADSERRFSSHSLPRRFSEHSRRTWPTVIVIFSLISFFLVHNAVHMFRSLALQRGERFNRQLYDKVLAWGWLFYLMISTVTPITLWLTSNQMRWFLRRFYLSCMCRQDELTSTYETKDSKLSKLVGLFLLAQRLRSERNNNNTIQNKSPAVICDPGLEVINDNNNSGVEKG